VTVRCAACGGPRASCASACHGRSPS
jgi:hypothetical protein